MKEHYVGLFVALCLRFSFGLMFVDCKIKIANSVTELSEYEASVCEEYRSKDLTYDEKVSGTLDKVEEFVTSKGMSMLITSHLRDEDSMTVSFMFGLGHEFLPSEFLSDELSSVD